MNEFRAIVIGPRDVPAITSERVATAFPSLAIVSAFARAKSADAVDVARVALSAVIASDADRAGLYYDLIVGALDQAARIQLEEWMNLRKFEPVSEWGKRHFAEGEAMGAREALFDVLAARELHVDAETRARIDGSKDVAQLRTWISRAVRADSIAEVFLEC